MYDMVTTVLLNSRKCTEIPIDGVDDVPEDTKIFVEEIEDCRYDDDDTRAPKMCVQLVVEGFV
jgi:hypothetical protein